MTIYITRIIFKLMLALLISLMTAVALVRAIPYEDVGLQAILTPPEGCESPCFMGIRPGVTTIDEAVAILRDHAWVDSVLVFQLPSTRQIRAARWTWSGQQPSLINASDASAPSFGSLESSRGVVTQIRVPTVLSAGDVMLLWGRADNHIISTFGGRFTRRVAVSYLLHFPGHAAWIDGNVVCPYFPHFLNLPVTVFFGAEGRLFPPPGDVDYGSFVGQVMNLDRTVCG